jgi:hypothetical protein
MTLRLASLAVLVALLGAFVVAPLTARAQAPQTIEPIPVTASKNNGTKNFEGAVTVTRFVQQGGTIFAEGSLTGEVTNKKGKVTHAVEETVQLPVTVVAGEAAAAQDAASQGNAKRATALQPVCDVLFLQLGPITLNLLGLNLQVGGGLDGTEPIIVEITADPSGGLLGQLLCGLAGGVPLPLDQLIQVLQLLNALFGLLG